MASRQPPIQNINKRHPFALCFGTFHESLHFNLRRQISSARCQWIVRCHEHKRGNDSHLFQLLWLSIIYLCIKLNYKKLIFFIFYSFFSGFYTQTPTSTSNTNTHLMAHQENIDQLQNHIIDKKYSLILTSQLSSGSKFNDLGFKRLTLNYKVDTCFFDFFSFFFPSSSICYFFNSIYIVFFSHFENNMSCLGLFYFFIFVKFSSFEGILFLN